MSKLEIKKIESQFKVESIETTNFKVWPIVRFYFAYQLQGNTNTELSQQKRYIKKNLLKNTFYGFRNYFSKYDYIVFSDSSERKKIKGQYVDKSVDHIMTYLNRSLLFETPLPKHYNINEISTEHISSKIPLYIATIIISLFVFPNIKNEPLLQKLISDANINLPYRKIIKKFIAQYYLGIILCKIYKPKALIVQCSYTNGGFVKAFNDQKVKVIEVQHGLISTSHSAYNIYKQIDSSYYPNYLFSYGNNELKVFNENNFFIERENVIPVGHYYLDYLSKNVVNDEKLDDILKCFRKSIVISVQEIPSEDKLIGMLIKAAELDSDILYVYKTRFRKEEDYKEYSLPQNIIFVNWLNIYELIVQTDFHGTMYSTCALEALSLGKPNILINIDGLSKEYFGNLLTDDKSTNFVDTPSQLVKNILSINRLKENEIIDANLNFIKPNYQSNIEITLKKVLK